MVALRALWLLPTLLVGCGSDPLAAKSDEETAPPEDVATAIGRGDGSPSSVRLFTVYEAGAG
ncbi:MAG TPA: hypothetical protein VMS65_11935, partial [Polyangiaceae bacterium]|nr:hypothetical protein [Polyangiaceae bacterium]